MKKAEDDNDVVVRIYEASGKPGRATISLWKPIHRAAETNFIEWNPSPANVPTGVNRKLILDWRPTEIKTLKLSLGNLR